MCFGTKSELQPEAYRINRLDGEAPGSHIRTRGSVERHLSTAPMPPGQGGRRYPKKHLNKEGHYPAGPDYYEYPTRRYPYNQNAKGKAHDHSPGGTKRPVTPGYVRTITDSQKNIHGVSYHPHGDRNKHVRAEEIMPRRARSRRR